MGKLNSKYNKINKNVSKNIQEEERLRTAPVRGPGLDLRPWPLTRSVRQWTALGPLRRAIGTVRKILKPSGYTEYTDGDTAGKKRFWILAEFFTFFGKLSLTNHHPPRLSTPLTNSRIWRHHGSLSGGKMLKSGLIEEMKLKIIKKRAMRWN